MAQRQLPFMVAGAGLPSPPGLVCEAKSHAERLFDRSGCCFASSVSRDA
ncbi:MAG: hypothetical protein ACRD0A_15795 [Acidimicrobiales bacterium]